METVNLQEMASMLPYFLRHSTLWSNYDKESDTLYLHFKKPSRADNSVMTEDEIILRYENNELVGITILHASKWNKPHRSIVS